MIKNTIRISTFYSFCSAFLLPCQYIGDIDKLNKKKYYVAITTSHLLNNNKLNFEDVEIHLDIFDANNSMVKYDIVEVFIGDSVCQEDDMMAVLVSIDIKYELPFNDDVRRGSIPNNIETCCLPAIYESEPVYQKIVLKGMMNPMYDKKLSIMSYRIIDDYHYYTITLI